MLREPGELVGGKYRVVRLIGDGGMGVVYEARHELLGSPAALKFLHPELTRHKNLAERFLQEARVSARIQSPHVARVTDVDSTPEGIPYLVMELLEGESLQALLDREQKLSQQRAVDFALQILVGLEAAHGLGVVHRDLKPDNVFVTPSHGGPILKLIDFGIAKLRVAGESERGLTRAGAIMGTPEYMAPEQFYGAERVDHRADLFSLGAMLYEMLTGHRPAEGQEAAEIVSQVQLGKVRPISERDPSIPASLAEVVHRALAAAPQDRFESAFEMRRALLLLVGELGDGRALSSAVSPPHEAGLATSADAGVTEDEPALPGRSESIPRTLPPDDGGAEPVRTSLLTSVSQPLEQNQPAKTEDASVAEVAAMLATTHPAEMRRPHRGRSRRRPRRSAAPLIALLLGVAVAGGLVLLSVFMRKEAASDADALRLSPTSAPATTISAQVDPTSVATPPPPPAQQAPDRAASPVPKKSPVPKPDAGAAPQPIPEFPPIVFPTSFPMPSTLPPLPSGFPTELPGLPGFPPRSRPPSDNASGPSTGAAPDAGG